MLSPEQLAEIDNRPPAQRLAHAETDIRALLDHIDQLQTPDATSRPPYDYNRNQVGYRT